MAKTKDEILQSALTLFNEMGVNQVSLRTIATDLGISLGNLTYHFKKRDEIIEALYLQLVNKLDGVVKQNLEGKNQFALLFEVPSSLFVQFHEYRFLLLDFVYINRYHERIRSHYQKLLMEREHQFEAIISSLVREDILREEKLQNEYKYLFKSLRIVSDFWLSSISIDSNLGKINKSDLEEGTKLLKNMIYPYLTKKGQILYSEL